MVKKRILQFIVIGVFLGMSPDVSFATIIQCTAALELCKKDVNYKDCSGFQKLGQAFGTMCESSGCIEAWKACS